MPVEDIARALDLHRQTLSDARRVFIGFSGGLDSTVLLHATRSLGLPSLIALHANHGLHGDAGLWDTHCARFCERLGVEYRSVGLQVSPAGRGLEAAAREARYHWFEQQLEPGDVLLLAHHLDDQAETLLLRLLRGAGPDGLGAMPPSRALGPGKLLRPLLEVPRRSLAAYGQAQGLSWIDDPSNDDEGFDRNYLRHQVLPRIEARWPAYRDVLSRTAGLLREARDSREALALERRTSVTGDPGFAVEDLPEDSASAALALRAWLHARGLAMPAQARLREFLRQVREGQGASLQAGAWTLTRYRDGIYAHGPRASTLAPRAVRVADTWHEPGIGGISLQCRPLDWAGGERGEEGLPEAFTVRGRRGGDRLATGSGHHVSLKNLLQDLGVPPWWRDGVPLLIEGQGEAGSVLAVGGLARAPRLDELGLEFTWQPETLLP